MNRIPLLFVFLCSTANAQSEDDSWQFTLTPYLWAAVVKGNVAADGAEPPPIDPDYNFFSLDNLKGFAFLDFTASKGRWSINSDLVYINFSDNFDVGPINTDLDLRGGALELSAGFRPADWQHTELLFGARALRMDVEINMTPGSDGSEALTWVDPIIGIRHVRSLGQKWDLLSRFDIGGFGVSSDWTLNALLGVGYRFNKTFSTIFGYRYLAFKFQRDDFLADLSVQGFGLGFRFNF